MPSEVVVCSRTCVEYVFSRCNYVTLLKAHEYTLLSIMVILYEIKMLIFKTRQSNDFHFECSHLVDTVPSSALRNFSLL